MTLLAPRSVAAVGVLSALSVLTLTACGGSGKSSATASSPPAAASSSSSAAVTSSGPAAATGGPTITIASFQYNALTVAPGATVIVVNNDTAPHTVTSKPAGQFDSHTVTKGSPGSFKAPTTPGTYSYICTVHPSMAGTLTVQ